MRRDGISAVIIAVLVMTGVGTAAPEKTVVADGDVSTSDLSSATAPVNESKAVSSSEVTSLSLSLHTTRGDELTPGFGIDPRKYFAEGQKVVARVEYSGLPSDSKISVVDDDVGGETSLGASERVSGTGDVNINLSYEEINDAYSNENVLAPGPIEIEARWVREGTVEITTGEIVLDKADTTIYVVDENVPDEWPEEASTGIDVYGWSKYSNVNADLLKCSLGGNTCLEVVENNPEINAHPSFEDSIRVTPSEHADVGEEFRLALA